MDKQTEEFGKEIARRFVESFIHEPYVHKIGKIVSAYEAVYAGMISRLLGLEDLVIQYEKFTRRASKRDIARQILTKDLKIFSLAEIDEEFPIYDKEKLINDYLAIDQIFKYAVTGEHEHARSLCTKHSLHNLSLAQLVLGEFHEAENTQRLIPENPAKMSAYREIKAVELWRYGHHDEAKQVLDTVIYENLRSQIMLCFLNREAWQVYPFLNW